MLTWEKVLTDLVPFHMLILYAFIDPLVVVIGVWMGWRADQAGKLILAGPSAALSGIAMGFLMHQLGGSWFEGGFLFGGAHAFFRVLGGFFWAGLGYGAHALKGRDGMESEHEGHERNT
jgi:hypothetical protein